MERSHTHKNMSSCSSSRLTSIPSHRRMMKHLFKEEIIILGFNILVMVIVLAAAAGGGGGTAASVQSPTLVSRFTGFNESDLLLIPSTNSGSAFGPNGSLVLDASNSTGIAMALHNSSVSIYDTETGLVSSFLTTFTFSTSSNHSFSTNGTLAFVVVPNWMAPDESLEDLEAIDWVSIEFATACNGDVDGSPGDTDRVFWHGPAPMDSSFQVSERVKNSSIQPLLPAWASLISRYSGKISCNSVQYNPSSPSDVSDSDSDSSAENVYQLFVEYNASSQQIVAGSVPKCFPGGAADVLRRGSFVKFSAYDLSPDVLFSGYPYIGIVAKNGGVYRISQWNFTTSDTGAYTTSAFSSIGTGTQRSGGGGGGGGGRSSTSSGGLYGNARIVVIISSCVIGASILVGVLFLVFIWRRRRDRRHVMHPSMIGGGVLMKGGLPPPPPPPVSSASAITHSRGPIREHVFVPDTASAGKHNDVMMNFEADPMQSPPEHDTLPLTRNASYASTDTMNWHLPPPVPR